MWSFAISSFERKVKIKGEKLADETVINLTMVSIVADGLLVSSDVPPL